MTEERPWGRFTVLYDSPNYKVKEILVKPHCRLSLQRHKKRSEHWYIISGVGKIVLDNTTQWRLFREGESVNIQQGMMHRIENKTDEDLIFIEIQTGTYFGEDDIERFEDDFGRN